VRRPEVTEPTPSKSAKDTDARGDRNLLQSACEGRRYSTYGTGFRITSCGSARGKSAVEHGRDDCDIAQQLSPAEGRGNLRGWIVFLRIASSMPLRKRTPF
jgi:hypothetical protein